MLPGKNDQTSASESTLERAQHTRKYVEELIQTVGEHPECELKREWRRDTHYHRAEFIKDVQAIVNSDIPEGKDNYVAVGADEMAKEITGCDHKHFDDADVRQVFEAYLDPVPDFEIMRLQAPNGRDFVVFRFPHQRNRPFIVRAPIQENNKTHLEEGELWFKPGGPNTPGSGKRRVRARSELLALINNEPRVQSEVNERLNQLLPQVRLEERTRLQPQSINAISAHTMTDEEFESYVAQILISGNETHFNILIEMLREKTVEIWFDREDHARFTPDDILRIKRTEFIPAMRRVTLLGLVLIKFSAPQTWFSSVAGLLIQIFNTSHELRKAVVHVDHYSRVGSLDAHTGYTVPAIESLLSSHALAGYELSRESNVYMGSLFGRRVQSVPGINNTPSHSLYMFWPTTGEGGAPDMRQDIMVEERYGVGDRIEKLFRGREGIRAAALQIDCLIEWTSFLSFEQNEAPEAVQYFKENYRGLSTSYWPHFESDNLSQVLPFVNQLWSVIRSNGEKNYWLVLPGLDDAFRKIDTPRRERLLGKFLREAEKNHNRMTMASGRIPYDPHWPEEIAGVLKRVRETEAARGPANS